MEIKKENLEKNKSYEKHTDIQFHKDKHFLFASFFFQEEEEKSWKSETRTPHKRHL